LAVSAPVSHVYAGEAVTFSYVVTNQGSLAASNLMLDVTIPQPYYQFQDPSGGLMAGNVLEIQVPNMAPGQTVTVEVGLRVSSSYKDEDKIHFPAELTYDQGPATGLTVQGPLDMPTGQLNPGELFIDVNEVRPGETANITLVPGLRGYINVRIYNSAGELVKTLEAQYPATEKEVIKRNWDAKNMHGEFVSSGVYVVYASMPGVVRTGRLVVIR
jgi:hypothetical protein